MKPQILTVLVVLAWLLGACSRPAPAFLGEFERTAPWDPEFVARMAELPVQDNGRVKPLATFAAFLLYKVHGRRDVQFELDGQKHKLEPTEWLLDVWSFPDQAADYPLFRIENTGVLDALGIANDGQSMEFVYLSYRELLKKAESLELLAEQYKRIDQQDRDTVQEHLVQTHAQIVRYHHVHQQMAPLHHEFRLDGEELRAVFGGRDQVYLGEFVAHAEAFRDLVRSVGSDVESPRLGNALEILAVLDRLVQQRSGPGLFPSPPPEEEWLGVGEPVDRALRGTIVEPVREMFLRLQRAIAATDATARMQGFQDFRAAVVAAATIRGEYDQITTEADYYRSSWHYRSLHWFIFAFLLAAVGWLRPRSKVLWWASFGVSVFALGLLVYDIYLRCIITGRPPIKNLYDTFLFIGALGVITALAVEWILRRRIALALAPLVGGLLVMLARMFEVADGKDTMDPLIAVLDSNYWLATHVTMINTGYAAGLVAAVLANAWVLVRVLRIAHPADSLSKGLVRAVYGVTCFSLLFSVVGTIYGGVWANDSWGRFWGWDPKENGALMICLSQIAMLHARWSGWIRDFGVVVWASITGMVVLFSWFHTNLLGVGLHNYGFSSGLLDGVWTGYSIELGVLLVGVIDVRMRPDPAHGDSSPTPAADASTAGAEDPL